MRIMCNSARDILLCMLSGTIHACAITKQNKLGWEREFKEFGQNLRKFGSSKKEFRFQAEEALTLIQRYAVTKLWSVWL